MATQRRNRTLEAIQSMAALGQALDSLTGRQYKAANANAEANMLEAQGRTALIDPQAALLQAQANAQNADVGLAQQKFGLDQTRQQTLLPLEARQAALALDKGQFDLSTAQQLKPYQLMDARLKNKTSQLEQRKAAFDVYSAPRILQGQLDANTAQTLYHQAMANNAGTESMAKGLDAERVLHAQLDQMLPEAARPTAHAAISHWLANNQMIPIGPNGELVKADWRTATDWAIRLADQQLKEKFGPAWNQPKRK